MKNRPATPRKVPVASRDKENAERAAQKAARGRSRALPKQDMVGVVVLIAVVLLVLMAIAAPLRNYYEGRAEIARANESITQLQAQKDALEHDIAMYDDEVFIKQEARRRLGVMEEGETAWRIIDPRMSAPENITTGKEDIPDDRSWPEVMWDSLRPAEDAPAAPSRIDEPPAAPAP